MAVGNESMDKNARGKMILLAQEIEFAKVLAGNDKRLRDKGIKKLRKWLIARSNGKYEFTDDDFLRIWKGIFYCMWMADKLLVQEELADRIANLVFCFTKSDMFISFVRCFFHTMILEWNGIDQFRYDKFMMLVRRFLRQVFKFCRNNQWQEEVVGGVGNCFSVTVLASPKDSSKPPPLSLVMHFCDIYMQELAKVGKEKIPAEVVTAFIQPFITLLSVHKNGVIRNKVMRDIFHYLMKQSDAALEFSAKWSAWKSAGFPGESWEDMERVELEDDEEEEEDLNASDAEMLENEPQDPRAGRVNVELPQIPFDSQHIADAIQQQVENCSSTKYSRALQYLAKQFIELSEGKYPLAKSEEKKFLIKPEIEEFKLKSHINNAVIHLNNFEQKLEKGKKRKNGQKKISNQKRVEIVQMSKNSNTNDETGFMETILSASPEKISKKENNKRSKVQKANIVEDSRTNGEGDSLETIVSGIPEVNCKQAGVFVNSLKGEGIYVDSPFPLPKTRKRRNSGLSAQGAGTPSIEPKLKVKKYTTPQGINDRSRSDTPVRSKRRRSSGVWEVSDSVDEISQKESVKKPPLSPSEITPLECIGHPDKSTPAESNERKVLLIDNMINKVSTPVNSKKVNIALSKNCSQDLHQYHMAVRQSPAIPYDGSKQPVQGVLKPSPVGSRINPFYRLKKLTPHK